MEEACRGDHQADGQTERGCSKPGEGEIWGEGDSGRNEVHPATLVDAEKPGLKLDKDDE